jgi:hypothetical protein
MRNPAGSAALLHRAIRGGRTLKSQDAKGLRRAALTFSKWLFTPLALLFLLTMLARSADTLALLFGNVHPGWLLLALLIWLALYFLAPWFTVQVLHGLGDQTSYRVLTSIFIRRLPAKYLPGGVWQTVARAWDLRGRGIDTPRITRMLAYELLMPLLAAFAIGGTLLAAFHTGPVPLVALALSAGAGLLAFTLLPSLLRRFPVTGHAVLESGCYRRAVLIILVYWVLAGTAFGCFINALQMPEHDTSLPELAGAYSLSWAVGYLAFFAPQGLGVLELAASRLIDLPLDTEAGISVVFSFRLMVIALDLTVWLAYSLFTLRRKG